MSAGHHRHVMTALLATVLLTAGCGDTSSTAQASAPAGDVAGGKVTVAGDSISVGLGSLLRTVLEDDMEVKVIGEEGTGLARPDSFDWPERLEELARDFPPEVLVFSVSSNDAQDLVDADGDVAALLADDDEWDREYSARLARSFDAFETSGTTVVWVGHVRTAEDRVGLRNRRIHELAEDVAAGRDWVQVRDLAEILDSGEGVASDCLRADGLHLSAECLETAAAELDGSAPIG